MLITLAVHTQGPLATLFESKILRRSLPCALVSGYDKISTVIKLDHNRIQGYYNFWDKIQAIRVVRKQSIFVEIR